MKSDKPKIKRPVSKTCLCRRCEKARFTGWRDILKSSLSFNNEKGGPRRQLVAEIHDYVGLERRKLKPELYTVISYIICYADMAAHCLLEALCMELASAIERKEPPEYACEFKKSS